MIIDCDSCQARPAACGDCVVSFVLGPMPWAAGDGLVDEERAALAVLADSGLLPPLRLVTPTQASGVTSPAGSEPGFDRTGRAVS
jgi:hypothetical protein